MARIALVVSIIRLLPSPIWLEEKPFNNQHERHVRAIYGFFAFISSPPQGAERQNAYGYF